MKKNPKQTVALNKTKPKQHKTALAKKTVIITRYKCTKPYGLPGRKGNKMWGRSFPSMVASIADCIFQGTMWQGSLLLLTMWQKKRTNEKNNPQQLNLNDNKTLSSLNNNQWETRAKKKKNQKRNLENYWCPKQVKCCWAICSVPLDKASPGGGRSIDSGSWN